MMFNANIHTLKSGKYQLSYILPNTYQRKRYKYQTHAEAEEAKKLLEEKFHPTVNRDYANHLVEDLMLLHFEKCPNSRLQRRKHILNFFLERFGKLAIKEVTKVELAQWLNEVKVERNLSVLTVKDYVSNINHFFDFLVDAEILYFSPLKKIPMPPSASVPRRRHRVILTQDEIKTILEQAKYFRPTYMLSFLTILVHTGARRAEVLNLRWQDIDFNRGTLTFCQTKNGDDRTIRIPDKVLEVLKTVPRRSPYIFTCEDGLPIGKNSLKASLVMFKKLFISKKNWSCHSFRHTFAHEFLKKGGEMYQLQAILGHRSIVMTIGTYGQLAASEIKVPSPYNF